MINSAERHNNPTHILPIHLDGAQNSMTDRRRVNGPPGGTSANLYASIFLDRKRERTRGRGELRKLC